MHIRLLQPSVRPRAPYTVQTAITLNARSFAANIVRYTTPTTRAPYSVATLSSLWKKALRKREETATKEKLGKSQQKETPCALTSNRASAPAAEGIGQIPEPTRSGLRRESGSNSAAKSRAPGPSRTLETGFPTRPELRERRRRSARRRWPSEIRREFAAPEPNAEDDAVKLLLGKQRFTL